MSLYKTAFSAQDQHILSFSHWAQQFLAIFSKAHKFVQNSVFKTRAAPFFIFALGAPLFSDFQQSLGVCTKQLFSLKSAHLSFSHWAHHFLALFSKAHQFVQNSVFSSRSDRFVIFALGALLFSHF